MEPRVGRYPQELRQRTVRTVAEVRPPYRSQTAAITSVAEKLRDWNCGDRRGLVQADPAAVG